MEDILFNKLFDVIEDDRAEEIWLQLIKSSEANIVDIRDDISGWSLLHYASENLFVKVIDWLLKNGADVNVEDINGRTPFIIALDASIDDAVQHERDKIDFSAIELLIRSGADENHVARDGTSKNSLFEIYGDNSRKEYQEFL